MVVVMVVVVFVAFSLLQKPFRSLTFSCCNWFSVFVCCIYGCKMLRLSFPDYLNCSILLSLPFSCTWWNQYCLSRIQIKCTFCVNVVWSKLLSGKYESYCEKTAVLAKKRGRHTHKEFWNCTKTPFRLTSLLSQTSSSLSLSLSVLFSWEEKLCFLTLFRDFLSMSME